MPGRWRASLLLFEVGEAALLSPLSSIVDSALLITFNDIIDYTQHPSTKPKHPDM